MDYSRYDNWVKPQASDIIILIYVKKNVDIHRLDLIQLNSITPLEAI